jgi:hypothetical protein
MKSYIQKTAATTPTKAIQNAGSQCALLCDLLNCSSPVSIDLVISLEVMDQMNGVDQKDA